MVLLVGLIASTKETTDPVFVFVLGILLIMFICGTGIFMFWKILQHWYIAGKEARQMVQNKLKKSFGSLNNVAVKSWGSLNNISNQVRGKKMNDSKAVEPATNTDFTYKKTSKLARK
jgi:hypothetical protein